MVGLEPNSIVINDAYDCDRCSKPPGRKRGYPIEAAVRRGIENVIPVNGGHALCFVGRFDH
jgi:hypothetical protein